MRVSEGFQTRRELRGLCKAQQRRATRHTPFRRQDGLPCLEPLLLESGVCSQVKERFSRVAWQRSLASAGPARPQDDSQGGHRARLPTARRRHKMDGPAGMGAAVSAARRSWPGARACAPAVIAPAATCSHGRHSDTSCQHFACDLTCVARPVYQQAAGCPRCQPSKELTSPRGPCRFNLSSNCNP